MIYQQTERSPDSGKALLLGLTWFAACLTAPNAAFAKPQPIFAEPGSGRPVTGYELSLPTTSGQKVFQVPSDCDVIETLYRVGDAARDRVMERRLWLKATGDCRYFALLHGNEGRDQVDYLAGYDFDALSLDDLPDDILCSGSPVGWCGVGREMADSAQPLFDPLNADRQYEDRTPCNLVDGRLRAEIWRGAESLVCVSNPRASLRLIGWDAADIDGDGIRDRILRLILISPAHGRRSLRLPLTRLGPEAPLTVPGRVPVDPD